MGTQQRVLLLINVFGGAAVIGSYVLGVQGQPGGLNALWGGVPEGIQPLYGISMLLAAAGYFAFLYFLLFRLAPAETSFGGRFGYSLLFLLFAGILLPSAFWMPLTNAYLAAESAGLWFAVRAVLALVGLASIALVVALASRHPTTRRGIMAAVPNATSLPHAILRSGVAALSDDRRTLRAKPAHATRRSSRRCCHGDAANEAHGTLEGSSNGRSQAH